MGTADTDLEIGDTTGPEVVERSPRGSNVPIDTVVTATFNEDMDCGTINETTFTLVGSNVPGTVTCDGDTATFTPDEDLEYGHRYTATISVEVTDAIGNPLEEEYSWDFTTERPSGWDKCGPIDLVIVLDTTGSMGSVIDSVTSQLTEIVDEAIIASGDDLRMGYIVFNDGPGCGAPAAVDGEQDFGLTSPDYVTVVNELTDDIDAVKTAISNTYATGGAGAPEASDEAKNTAVNNLPGGSREDASGYEGMQYGDFTEPYRSSALKLVILITDNSHGGFNDVWDESDSDAMHEYALDALENDILVSDVYIGSDSDIAEIFEDDAETTGGIFVWTSSGSNVGDAILDILESCGQGEEPDVVVVEEDEKKCPAVVEGPAEMNIQSIHVENPEVVQNEWVYIWISVGNSGGSKGTKSISLLVNGQLEQSQTVGVGPGGGENVLFQVRRAVPGTYTVSVEGREAQFTVLGMGPPQAAPAPPMASAGIGGALGTGGIIAIIVVIIALAIGLVIILKKQ
jgi:hypothetical protein